MFRNKFFINFPGRDLGGILAFLKGFRNDAWLALAIFIFVVPGFLFLFYLILSFFNLQENENWTYGWNFLVFVAAVAQQVLISL